MDYTLTVRITLPGGLPGPGSLLHAATEALKAAGLEPGRARVAPVTSEVEWEHWWNCG